MPSRTLRPRKIMKIRSQSRSATAMSCVEKTTVVPAFLRSSTASLTTSALTGSRPVNGSSRIRSSGRLSTPAMNWIFWAIPLESASTFLSIQAESPMRSSQRVDRAVELGLPRPLSAP